MRKIVKFLYWLLMSMTFLLLLFREHKISKLNHIDVEGSHLA